MAKARVSRISAAGQSFWKGNAFWEQAVDHARNTNRTDNHWYSSASRQSIDLSVVFGRTATSCYEISTDVLSLFSCMLEKKGSHAASSGGGGWWCE